MQQLLNEVMYKKRRCSLGKFKGIVFDLDGTLVNTEVDFRQMKHEMIIELESSGIPAGILTPEMTTVAITEYAKKIWAEKGLPLEDQNRILAEITRIMDEVEMKAVDTLKVIEGASQTIRKLHDMGYKLAVLTRSNHIYAQEAIKKMNVDGLFDVVLGRGDTSQPKPSPEAMIEATKSLKLNLKEVFMVGDHNIDSTCAWDAGCIFIGVSTGPRGDKSWENKRPGVILKSVVDLPFWLEENDP